MVPNRIIYLKMTLVHFLYLTVLLLFAGGYAIFGLLDDISTNSKLLHFNNIVMGVVLTFLVLYLFCKLNKKSVRSLGWHLKIKDLYYLLMVSIASMITVGILVFLLKQNHIVNGFFQFNKLKDFHYYLLLIWALFGWLMASLKEEVLSRGYVLFNLKHLNTGMMYLVSAAIFMVLHLPTNGFDLFKMASWFMGGVAYAYVYMKSGSIVVSTITHMIHNYLNDWILGNNHDFSILSLDLKVPQHDKLLYEIILKLSIIFITFAWYRQNGITAPATNLKEVWTNGKTRDNVTF